MGVTKTKAWFSVTESLSETFGLNHYPFAFMSQYFNSQKILMVDHSTLHLIRKNIQKLQGNCILINNTGRCGSTLICQVWYLILNFFIFILFFLNISGFSDQMFAKLPKTSVMSEPWALFYIHRLYKNGHITWKEYQNLIETCVKLLFKPTKQAITER